MAGQADRRRTEGPQLGAAPCSAFTASALAKIARLNAPNRQIFIEIWPVDTKWGKLDVAELFFSPLGKSWIL